MKKRYFVCPDCGLVDNVEMHGYTITTFYIRFSGNDYDWDAYEEDSSNNSMNIHTILCPNCYNEIAEGLDIASDDYDTIYKYQIIVDTKNNKIEIGEFAKELLIEYVTNNVFLPEEFSNKNEFTDEDLVNIVKLILLEEK